MPFVEKNNLRYFRFKNFPRMAQHAVFTRNGGVSPAPWNSLNVGGNVGDSLANVRENRLRIFAALGRPSESVFDLWQVHGTQAYFAAKPRPPDSHEEQGDLMFTDNPHITLYMRFADCVPLLFADPKRGVVGLAHAGWRGTVLGVAEAAIEAMRERYGSRPEDVYAAIAPSIGADHYEVGETVISAVRKKFGRDAESLLPAYGDKRHFDLWAANRLLLMRVGVRNIETAGICTACHLDDWFSHRAEGGETGRFAALIGLKV